MQSKCQRALGLPSGQVHVLPYDARWPRLFDEAAAELERAVGAHIIAVHHVGSTAVPGLAAKPILDMLISIRDFEQAREIIPLLAQLGYEFRPHEEIPDRHYFRRRRGTVGTHHLSLAELHRTITGSRSRSAMHCVTMLLWPASTVHSSASWQRATRSIGRRT